MDATGWEPLLLGRVDIARGVVVTDAGAALRLTHAEAALLAWLVARPGQVCSRDALRIGVWGHTERSTSRAVDTTVRRLRSKIERDPARPEHLLTVHGEGYRWVPALHTPAPPVPPSSSAPEPVRRAPAAPPPLLLPMASVELDSGRVLRRDGTTEQLSEQERRLLAVLAEAEGRAVPRRELSRAVLGGASAGGSLASALLRLRRKLDAEDGPSCIVSGRGQGVRLVRRAAVDTGPPLPPSNPFVGRAEVLDAALDALRRARVVTLLGPGGVGKTRLAMELAARHSAALPPIAWCELAPVREPQAIPRLLAIALRAPPGADATALGRLAASRGPGLLIVDNAEHLYAPLRELLAVILRQAPEQRVLVTSRRRLGLADEVPLQVPLLGPADGRRLFEARAPRPELAHPALDALLDRLDGLPLAIELAAARSALLTPAQMLTRFSQDPDTLRGEEGPDRSERHASLRATLAWSLDLLSPQELRMLARCAVFQGGFTLEAAEVVLGGDAIAGLGRLVEHSLLQVHDRPTRRFALLESMRVPLDETLARLGATADTQARHRACYAALAERWMAEGRAGDLFLGDPEIRAELGNLEAAWEAPGALEDTGRLALLLSGWQRRTGELDAALARLDHALALFAAEAAATAAGTRLHLELRVERTHALLAADRVAAAEESAAALLAADGLAVDQRVLVLNAQALISLRKGEIVAASAQITAALALLPRLDAGRRGQELVVATYNHAGIVQRHAGHNEAALALYRRALVHCPPHPVRGVVLLNVAIASLQLQQVAAGATAARDAIRLLTGSPYLAQLSQAWLCRGEALMHTEAFAEAEDAMRQGCALAASVSSTINEVFALRGLAGVLLGLGRDAEAGEILHRALDRCPRDLHRVRAHLWMYEGGRLARSAQAENHQEALAAFEEAERHFARIPDDPGCDALPLWRGLLTGAPPPPPAPDEPLESRLARRVLTAPRPR